MRKLSTLTTLLAATAITVASVGASFAAVALPPKQPAATGASLT